MIFSTSIFLVYFLPLVILLYLVIPNRFKNYFLLGASILFYSWGAPRFIYVVLLTTTIDYYLVQSMDRAKEEKIRKLFLLFSLLLNLGLLFYFKYCNFFVDNFNYVLSWLGAGEIKWTKVILPIGISFYTFETITYVVDVYRKQHKPLSDFMQYQLYILLFPKLIAGPIIRFSQIADQFTERFAEYNVDMILNGFFRFSIGLAKKVLIANEMAAVADFYFGFSPDQLNPVACWTGALAYTFHIYFDFSGYSDMAIGLGRIFGFTFPENFNNPYTSLSITEFWRRWHMTLGAWMKNYLYIPLGGNRVSGSKLYFNLALVFVLSGFWHGASWTFIVWGLYHGFWLVLERMFLLKLYSKIKVISLPFIFTIVILGWVFFRADNFTFALSYIGQMFNFSHSNAWEIHLSTKTAYILYAAGFFSVFVLLPFGQRIQNYIYFAENRKFSAHVATTALALTIFTISLASVASGSFNPFIYFRF